jgi:type I restriction enzyme S subunit
MKRKKLGSFVRILSGYPFKSSLFNNSGKGLPIIRVRDVNTGFAGVYYDGNYPKEYLIDHGDILISMDGDFKCIEWQNGQALLNQRVCKIISDPNALSQKYLLHFLPKALLDIHSKTIFTTVKHLSIKDIRNIEVPLPSLEDQIRIGTLLSRVEALIATHKNNLRLLNEFLKSIFLEMFKIQGAAGGADHHPYTLFNLRQLLRTGPGG